jgi:hypothetical protein
MFHPRSMVRLVLSGNETDRVNECYGDFAPTMLSFQFGDNSHQNRSAAR